MDFCELLGFKSRGRKWEFGEKDGMAQEGRRRQQQHNLLKRLQSTDVIRPLE